MLTRRYKMYEHTRAQASQQCQEVKALPWNITRTCEQSIAKYWPFSSEESVEECHSDKQHLTMSMDHLENGTSLSRLHEALMISLYRGNKYSLSPYRPRAFDHLLKKNMPGKLFFVFASIRVPMYRTYVICTWERHNISLIEDQLR